MRWLRAMVTVLLVVTVVVLGAAWLVTRSWFIVGRAEPVLSQLLGGEVTIGDAAYEWGGRLRFRDIVVRVPSIAGPGGEVCRVVRATVEVDPMRLLRGDVRLEHVEIGQVRIRLSEAQRSAGDFNFMELTPNWTPVGAGAVTLPPHVQIDRALIEVGVHDGAAFTMRGQRTLSGSMRPHQSHDGWYGVTLIEVDDGGTVVHDKGILVDGQWNARTNEHSMKIAHVELNDRAYGMCPQIARLWWDEMNLEGHVASVDVHWSVAAGFHLSFDVEDVGLTLPIDTTEFWARYRGGHLEEVRSRARMHVRSGRIELSRDAFRLEDLAGELLSVDPGEDVVGVPYRVTVTIDELPALDWANQAQWTSDVLARAPFEMSIRTEEFRVRRDEDGSSPAVEVPLAFAKVLEKFRFTDWVLTTAVDVSRAAPGPDPDAPPEPIRSSGQAFITHASGRYERFPYALENIQAYLEFDNDQVTIHSLTGEGTQGATVRLSGSIESLETEATLALVLTARDVPLDGRLRAALTDGQRRVFDSLLDRSGLEALRAAGLLAEPFEVGGTIDLDMRIDHAGGAADVTRSGRVSLHEIGLLYERFPYPIRVMGGDIDWEPGRVSVVPAPGAPGLPVVTAGGGRGWLAGFLDLTEVDGRTRVKPNVTLTIEDDATTDVLYAAIPPGSDAPGADRSWPGGRRSAAAQWLHDLGVSGRLDYSALIHGGGEAAIEYDIDVALVDGRAEPGAGVLRELGAPGTIDPADWSLRDVRGRAQVSRRAIELEGFEGHLTTGAQGRVAVDGRLDLAAVPAQLALDVRLDDVEIRRELLSFLPESEREEAYDVWDELDPKGMFGVDLHVRTGAGAPEALEIRFRPETAQIRLGEEIIGLVRESGDVRLRDSEAAFDALRLALDDGRGGGGRVTLQGTISGDGPSASPFRGSWTGGQLDSPIIREAIRLFSGDDEAERYASFQPKGAFDAEFGYWPAPEQTPPFEARVRPRDASFVMGETPIHVDFNDAAEVRLSAGRIRLVDVEATHVAGTVRLAGVVDLNRGLDATIDVGYEGRLVTSQVSAFLPEGVRGVMEAIEIQEGQPSSLEGGRLRLTADGTRSQIDFAGQFLVNDASFTAGTPFTEITGPIQLEVRRRDDEPLALRMVTHPLRMKLLGQHLSDVEVTLQLNPEGTMVELKEFRADARTGAVTGQARVGVGDNRSYSIDAQLVDVPIGDFLLGPPDEGRPAAPPERRQGGVFAKIEIAGERGDPGSRVGRGVARIMGDTLGDMPFALRLLQPFHATIPIGEWDFANADFFVVGDRLIFEEILFESSLDGLFLQHLHGTGELNLSTFELDTQFRSRGGVLVLRDLMGNIGDRLALIEVTGPLWDPVSRVVALPSTSDRDRAIAVAPPVVRASPEGLR